MAALPAAKQRGERFCAPAYRLVCMVLPTGGAALFGLQDGLPSATLDASSKHRPAMTEQVAEAPGDQVVEQHVDRECSGGA